MDLPGKIFEENNDKIKGVIIFIDEFQIIKELDNYLESFLWKFRSFIQNQPYVAYVLRDFMHVLPAFLLILISLEDYCQESLNSMIKILKRNL